MRRDYYNGMRWVPSPGFSDSESIRGVYLRPDEQVEWFFLRPRNGRAKVVGYAIRKLPRSRPERRELRLVK
ncbi:MAG: hypothetical protein PHG91_02520 [Syntrophales bacterium]|nr:hypothetical protein [Syntrophales bacterium]MDD5232246.1 hypothetical protein [Syntrophales bacterium]MDD5531730.1 hypothetical protein [Syntrophales bacterium]HPL64653.1 hypothetical protein [Syntrophales bacterium]